MQKAIFLFAFFQAIGLLSFGQKTTITKIDTGENYFVIYYDLESGGKKIDMDLFVSKDGGKSWIGPMEDALWDVGVDLKEGCCKSILWKPNTSF
jgi:hypothetical protein